MKDFINATTLCNKRHESETCTLLRALTNARRKQLTHTKTIRHKRHAYVHLHISVRTYTPTCLPYYIKKKGKAIPLQAWASSDCSRRLRLPDFKTIGT